VNNFPNNLRYLRKKNGLRQDEMLARIGVARTTWSNYENGKTNPRINELITFSKFFGISLDDLIIHDLAARDPLPSKTVTRKGTAKPRLYAVNNRLSMVSENDFKYVLDEVKRLREEINSIKDGKNG
jgi:transcriptional regulator with XRE-family HTH domain